MQSQLVTKKKYPLHRCLHHFIEEQAEKTPDAEALKFEDETVSYYELNARANYLAKLLKLQGVGPDTIVGVCAERSIEMVIALLAVLKADGAYMPLDPSLPQKRLAYMVDESNTPLILVQSKFQNQFDPAIKLFDLNDYAYTGQLKDDNPESECKSDNIAYVIYTSGSTGTPKGVMNQHNGIVNRLLWMQEEFRIGEDDTVVQKTPYSFDVSVWEFFWPLMVGACLVIARPEGHKDPDYLLNLIQTENITVIHFVPSMLRLLLQADNLERAISLRYVICSGEVLDVGLQNRFFECCDATLYNLYGPTEAAVDVTYWRCSFQNDLKNVPIGHPIANIELSILDGEGEPVSKGDAGELYISGVGVARGYLNRADLTSEKFIKTTLDGGFQSYQYKTGDLVRMREDGAVEYLGRIDSQVKIRGFRIELGEIEACLELQKEVERAVVIAREDLPGYQRLVGYIIESEKEHFSISKANLELSELLPEYMVPSQYVVVEEFPLSSNGKLDRKKLPRPSRKRPAIAQPYIRPQSPLELSLVEIWEYLLDLEEVGIDDNFFEIGGTSLLAVQMIAQINQQFKVDYQVVRVFQYPTIAQLAEFIKHKTVNDLGSVYNRFNKKPVETFEGVAIVGMAGRFPGADSIPGLWQNLLEGVESIDYFSREELDPGIDESLRNDPDYVPARGIIKNADMFDAAFFGISPIEAKVIDPQQRVFLELAWSALENAGYDALSYTGTIGAFAGIGDNHYYSNNLLGHGDLLKTVGNLSVEYGNQKDYIATRACYALSLTGPGVSVNTGCSTSLLAIDMAFRSLRDYECDIALAGGVDIHVPQKSGFLYQKGGTFANDGHCRPFDAAATGTMFCDGAGIVVLKRLKDALADNDTIYAVLAATAKNNDGSNKVSFLAPSVDGQAKVIAMAQAIAGVHPEEIGYIEAHGTATPTGDPIEIEALTKAFRFRTEKKQYCWIGSIKGNIGHPTIASGVTGLIKAALCLHNEKIPKTLHFRQPNPQIDFNNSPFKVIDHLQSWPRNEKKRIAAVSSFGFGGTNVHAILREAPPARRTSPSRPAQLILLSAKNNWSLDKLTEQMKDHLADLPNAELPDAVYTLQRGRRYLSQRRYVVVADSSDVEIQMDKLPPQRSFTRKCTGRDPEVIFLFPGQGSQYVQMGRQLYQTEPLFHQTVDRCCRILEPYIGINLLSIIHPETDDDKSSYEALKDTFFTQPAIFTIEYSLAVLWMSWGIKPARIVGHSIGEFAGACIAGVFSLEDALKLVAARGKLMKDLPRGSMLSVRTSAEEIEVRLPAEVQLAAANGPSLCVVSGPDNAVDKFQNELEAEGILCRKLNTSHAFHSAMMDPIVPLFTREVSTVNLHPPLLPIISSVNGKPLTLAEATSAEYWGRHLRMPVRFSNAAKLLVEKSNSIFLEVGPRSTLVTLVRQHAANDKEQAYIASLSDNADENNELISLLSALGKLWLHGCYIDWDSFYSYETRRRVPLPTYPFNRKRFWVDPVSKLRNESPDLQTDLILTDGSIEESPQRSDAAESGDADYLQQRLTEIFSETSGIPEEQLIPNETFLDLGMDSLFLSMVVFQLKKEFNVKLSFGQLLNEFPTIASLTSHLKKEGICTDAGSALPETGAQSGGIQMRSTATLPQKGIWLSSQFGAGPSCAYNESISIRFEGKIDISLLKKSIEFLAHKHHALRAHFEENGAIMAIEPDCLPEVKIIELSLQESADLSEITRKHSDEEASTAFNLDTGPLFRARILYSETAAVLIFTGHHIICDGWSLDVLIEDLLDAYRCFKDDSVPNKQIPYTFSQYVEERVSRESADSFLEQKAFWIQMFKNGIPVLALPTDTPRPSLRSYCALRLDRLIPSETITLLHSIGKQNSCSFFSIFLSGLGMFLHLLTGKRDLVIGLPTAEQARINQKKLVGHCVNIIPLCIHIKDEQLFTDLIAQTQHDLIEAYDNQDYTLIHLLADQINQTQSAKEPPVAVGLTSVKRWEQSELPDIGMPFDYWANPKRFESFELYFNVVESASQTQLTCHYNSILFTKERVEHWLDTFLTLLSKIAFTPELSTTGDSSVVDFTPPVAEEKPEHPLSSGKTITAPLSPSDPEIKKLEVDLANIWKHSLGLRDIKLDTSFFDAGGNSLLAAKLFADIERTLGIKAPLAILYEAPTIATLAAALGRKSTISSWKNIVAIKPDGSRPPLFLIHGAEGNVLLYRDLAKYLHGDIPLYGLQSSGLDGKTSFDPCFEIVAARYIEQIRSVQPKGPYYLGGYCLGGSLALEVAQQLKKAGESIAFLCMIENYNIQEIQWPLPWYLRTYNSYLNVLFHIKNLFFAENGMKMAFFKTKAHTELSRFRLSRSLFREKFLLKTGLNKDNGYHHLKVSRMYDDALAKYKPCEYDGSVHLYVAHQRFAGFDDSQLGWGTVIKNKIIINELPVYPHGTLVEPYVQLLAEKLSAELETTYH